MLVTASVLHLSCHLSPSFPFTSQILMEAELYSGKKLVVIKKHGFESQIFYLVIVLQRANSSHFPESQFPFLLYGDKNAFPHSIVIKMESEKVYKQTPCSVPDL